MGNHRFRLSDMIPNAWFYKLKEMGRPRNQTTRKKHQPKSLQNPTKSNQPHLSHQRKSYYFSREIIDPPPSTPFETTLLNYNSPKNPKFPDTHFPDPPRKSTKKKRNSKKPNRPSENPSAKLVTSYVSASCSCRASLESVWTKPDSGSEDPFHSPLDSSSDFESLVPELGSDHVVGSDLIDGLVSSSSSCHCTIMETKSFNGKFSEIELPPIITKKTTKFTEAINDLKKKETIKLKNSDGSSREFQRTTSPIRRFSVSSPGVRLRTNSPRITCRKVQSVGRKSASSGSTLSSRRKSLSESFAVVKASSDPQKDFRESMVEMIIENNLKASKDLEDLLACYLSLNSYEYHELIIRVFKKIWFDLSDTRLK